MVSSPSLGDTGSRFEYRCLDRITIGKKNVPKHSLNKSYVFIFGCGLKNVLLIPTLKTDSHDVWTPSSRW